ncbi:hypothetical protein MTER_37370 [Mycolicibacter terrae]|uniref:Uncharacterized protein n=1 Tax=Mycolicibacter terrae TaxID=1788 RepID=A0AAD1MIY8_9MYCO|nr:hypothetical protein [Mycolicibacter terrae]ORW93565.1 hypothetical protein AWC28_15900 [Mycolicibacter terrae]BBX24326.1 hypothetical protein MTER_37370 [Mycolicibacter terrae]SNV54330.1 Uncharacterised protein [Mycolicibacter terrae]
MEPPNNPAEALDRLLWKIIQSGVAPFRDIIGNAVGAGVGSVEFVNRHSAVVGLINELQTFLDALPDGHELKTRHLSDMPAYYNAVVYPGDWGANVNPSTIIDANLIKLLGGLGTTLKVMAAGTTPVAADIEKLETSLTEWEAMLESAGLPDGLADQIRGQVKKIRDLLTQVDNLGYGPVIRESQSLLGYGIRALKVAKNVGHVATCYVALFEFIAHVQVQDWGSAANVLTGAFNTMGEALNTARETDQGLQLALNGAEQLAIEAKKVADVIEEVVDDASELLDAPKSPTPDDGVQG